MRICHVTDAHSPFDDRIYLKECISLSQAGYITYIAARGNDCVSGGIHIIGCGEPKGRVDRMLFFARRVYRKAASLDCDVYHFHDPELLPYALKMKRRGKKVIFDSHEDVPAQILDKTWIPRFLRKTVSVCYRHYETYVVSRIDAVVTATPHIAKQFEGRARKVVTVNNYPRLDDIVFHDTPFEDRDRIICYAGGIDEMRGETVMAEAMRDVDGVLVLAGEHERKECRNVKYIGRIDRGGINELYGRSIAGLVLLLPTNNYINSLPIKMFEYMAAGLPFIASDFPLWKEIVEKNRCGICVPVNEGEKIREAVVYLLSHQAEAMEMGRNGRRAVENKYNWGHEKLRLIGLYREL